MSVSVKLIGFAGKKRVGKDTAGEYLCSQYGFERMAFADPLKRVCAIMFGLSDEQLYGELKETVDIRYNYTPRQILQKFGTEMIREKLHETFPLMGDSSQFWIDCFKREYSNSDSNGVNELVCVTDVRFENEAKAIIDLGGIVILIERGFGSEDTHSSEKIDISDSLISYRIDNNGTIEQLYEQIRNIVQK
jgi:hypothetical protein